MQPPVLQPAGVAVSLVKEQAQNGGPTLLSAHRTICDLAGFAGRVVAHKACQPRPRKRRRDIDIRKKPQKRRDWWVTGVAFSPYDGCLYASQYEVSSSSAPPQLFAFCLRRTMMRLPSCLSNFFGQYINCWTPFCPCQCRPAVAQRP
jgi:hypothetical protein